MAFSFACSELKHNVLKLKHLYELLGRHENSMRSASEVAAKASANKRSKI